jgi:tetratricopeptide (TPR) repeat protein
VPAGVRSFVDLPISPLIGSLRANVCPEWPLAIARRQLLEQSGTARLEQAAAAYRAALQEYTRDRVPFAWALTQNNLGTVLFRPGEREGGTARLEEAVGAYRAALEERTHERVPLDWAMSTSNEGVAMVVVIADRTNDAVLAEAAVRQIELAYETMRLGGHERGSAFRLEQLPRAQAIRDRLKGRSAESST